MFPHFTDIAGLFKRNSGTFLNLTDDKKTFVPDKIYTI